MIRRIAGVVMLLFLGASSLAFANDAKAEELAASRAEAWLGLVDQGKYADSWDEAAQLLKGAISKDKWTETIAAARNPLGKLVSRKLKSKQSKDSLPGAPDGKYVMLEYDASFEHKRHAVETITPTLDADGTWRVSGYYLR